MKIQLLSDVHLEFAPLEMREVDADVVVLAGDIGVGKTALDWVRQSFADKPVIYVLGNHEYYGKAYPKLLTQLRHESRDDNIHLLEDDEIEIDGVCFFGCTLWTDYNLLGDPAVAEFAAMQVVNDYRRIRRSPSYSKLRALDTAVIHKQSISWLEQRLAQRDAAQKTVVVTHHAPSARSVPREHRKNILSAAFASNLDEFIRHSEVDLWIHGHLHRSSDYQVGSSRVICNPRGYPHEEVRDFQAELTVEI